MDILSKKDGLVQKSLNGLIKIGTAAALVGVLGVVGGGVVDAAPAFVDGAAKLAGYGVVIGGASYLTKKGLSNNTSQ